MEEYPPVELYDRWIEEAEKVQEAEAEILYARYCEADEIVLELWPCEYAI